MPSENKQKSLTGKVGIRGEVNIMELCLIRRAK